MKAHSYIARLPERGGANSIMLTSLQTAISYVASLVCSRNSPITGRNCRAKAGTVAATAAPAVAVAAGTAAGAATASTSPAMETVALPDPKTIIETAAADVGGIVGSVRGTGYVAGGAVLGTSASFAATAPLAGPNNVVNKQRQARRQGRRPMPVVQVRWLGLMAFRKVLRRKSSCYPATLEVRLVCLE